MKSPIFVLLFLPYLAANYFDRDYHMPIAAAAYSDDPSQCWSNIIKYDNNHGISQNVTFSIYRQYSARCDTLNDTCSGYIAVQSFVDIDIIEYDIFVAFRGTNNNYAFFENGWNYNEMVPFVKGGKVSKAFFDGFNDLWNSGMKNDLLTLKNKYPGAQFRFVGHSIGGAMAALAAAMFKTIGGLPNYLYTFGQPRTGDKDFANAFHTTLDGLVSHRIVHKADIVPHLPPLNESIYYHHGREHWYNNNMGVNDDPVECSYKDGEDPKCSDSLSASDYNMEDHKSYYGRNFVEYGKNGCPDLLNYQRMHKNVRAKIYRKRFVFFKKNSKF